ncbi:hypothetical protein [Arthrobacter sp.]|uniref:hypothetical protein n=1 Tax=Arthrobacter sp. TaxID=1667 RepID=UPI0026DF8CAC|nr:hypothetical protein [Arthrobacter sp.]MDO5754004.1 hypothetical protein [Arthrobacter sp.]
MSTRISHTGTSPTGPAPTRNSGQVRRHVVFRIAAGLLSLIMLVGFSSWLLLLAPWLVLPNVDGHGWTRTAELHRLADSSSGLLMAAVGVAALLLLIRPQGRPALLTWTVAMTTVMVALAPVSAAIQGNNILETLAITVVFIAVLVLPLVLLNPDRRTGRRSIDSQTDTDPFADDPSGFGSSHDSGPTPLAKAGLLVLGAAGVALAAGVVLWRMFEDVFENPLEDDVLGLATLGISFALGALLCVRRRTGWLTLTWILAAMTGYAVVAGLSIALT